MVKGLCPMHTYSPPASFANRQLRTTAEFVVLQKLEFISHIDELAKTEGGSPRASVAL